MADFDRSTFGTTKARAVDHGEINARSKGQPAGDAFQKKASEWLDPDAESKRNPSSTVVTPFLPPVDEAKAEILEILIERGAPLDIDAATADDLYERGPPLNVALSRGRDILAGRLLDAGADAVAARAAESPLHVACDCGNVAMAARLLAAGARADAEDEDGETPLERATYACRLRYAMSEDELAMLERLLEGTEDATVVEG
ncbi:hypothetical protein JL721_8214 [Aureococcus anophagefferens]|nr:hypothetical protein JL721_8214 [Aureococcus anophagefferens]